MARIAVAALSARALAEAAQRDGHEVLALDLFGDRDTRAAASLGWAGIGESQALRIDAERLLTALRGAAAQGAEGWVCGSGFDGLPELLAQGQAILPLWGKIGRLYGLIPVEREQGAKALRKMLAAAREQSATGRMLAIFPEGTRIAHGTHAPLQSGFAGLYKLLGMPVVPIAVDSGPLYHRRWKRPGTITISVGETIPPGLPRDEVEARVRKAINALNPGAPA